MNAPAVQKKSFIWIVVLLTLAGLIAISVMLFLKPSGSKATSPTAGAQIWTCSMHPQVRLPNPGDCPICSMPLIPANPNPESNSEGKGEPMLTLSEHARAMASVESAPVERRKMSREIRAVGKVQYNESALSTITARVDGYIEKLFIDYTGVEVKAGDHLVEIYSPDLIVAQQELLMNVGQNIAQAARLKLRRWELTGEQIDEIIRTRKPQERITLSSPINGTVIEKMVVKKSSVKAGDILYRLANLDSVWVYLDIYEYELGWIRYGQTVEISTEAYPGHVFTGRLWFISPTLSDESRTVKVLVNIANEDKRLKPGMFASAIIRTGLLADGQMGPTGVEGKWTCSMHPQILESGGGPCPVCKMDLVQIPHTDPKSESGDELVLAIPVSAVLDSGLRQIAYVERAKGEYVPAELKLGSRAGDFYPVLGGLKEGDRVAVRGNFLLDSQFQIRGLPSLFYEHGQVGAAGHQHGGSPGSPASKVENSGAQDGKAAPKPTEHKH